MANANDNMPQQLFVYGTLRPAMKHPMYRVLEPYVDTVQPATVPGELFDLGAYPGLVLSDNGDAVVGELLGLRDAHACLRKMDAYEGCGPSNPTPHEFARTTTAATLSDGTTVNAWVYIYAFSTDDRPRVDSGDYLNR